MALEQGEWNIAVSVDDTGVNVLSEMDREE